MCLAPLISFYSWDNLESFWYTQEIFSCNDFITWPKIFDFGQVLFSSACMCLCVCLCVSLHPDYLKKFLTDFDETWQDDVEW